MKVDSKHKAKPRAAVGVGVGVGAADGRRAERNPSSHPEAGQEQGAGGGCPQAGRPPPGLSRAHFQTHHAGTAPLSRHVPGALL